MTSPAIDVWPRSPLYVSAFPPCLRPIFLDEAPIIALGRSHAWVQKAAECVELHPMYRNQISTRIGAIDQHGWVIPRVRHLVSQVHPGR